jgi:hypothetical protein
MTGLLKACNYLIDQRFLFNIIQKQPLAPMMPNTFLIDL